MSELKLKREALEWREVEGEIVALDVGSAEYVAANGSGALLWRHLAGGATSDTLVDALTTEFRVDRDTAERDVGRFVTTLRERGLLE
jgi:hypothetical protein